MLSHPKDPIPTMKKSGVVYRIPCADCDKSYVGQTGRNLSLRIKEHKKAVETFNTDTSALAEHVLSEDHHINWEETTVIGRHPFTNTRCIVESWFINTLPGTINREKGLLPDAYRHPAHITEPHPTDHTHTRRAQGQQQSKLIVCAKHAKWFH